MGNAYRMFFVGNCYEEGIGIEKDEKKIFECYKKSAEMGFAEGINKVGDCYRERIRVEKK